MQEQIAKTTIYNLIDAGHLARKALLVPLQSHGLISGDDAILFALAQTRGESEKYLSQFIGLELGALDSRLARLEGLGIIIREDIDNKEIAKARLSEKGEEITKYLVEHWRQLEEALIGELSKQEQEDLQKILKRFIKLLSLNQS